MSLSCRADFWGFKWYLLFNYPPFLFPSLFHDILLVVVNRESQDSSVYGPKKLFAAGVPVAMKSDHPAVGYTGRFLMFEAAKIKHCQTLHFPFTILDTTVR
jgi:hypothetical protein